MSTGSLFYSEGTTGAAEERAPSVGSIFCYVCCSRVLLFERRLWEELGLTVISSQRESMNSLKGKK